MGRKVALESPRPQIYVLEDDVRLEVIAMSGNVAIARSFEVGRQGQFSKKLASEGYKVLAFDIDKRLKNKGVQGMVADVSKVDQVEALVEKQKLGVIKVVVNNAGAWRRRLLIAHGNKR